MDGPIKGFSPKMFGCVQKESSSCHIRNGKVKPLSLAIRSRCVRSSWFVFNAFFKTVIVKLLVDVLTTTVGPYGSGIVAMFIAD